MKKILALVMALLFIGVIGVSATAQQVGAQNAVRARINKMGALGNGIAVSESDPMDFEIIKIGIAGVKVGLADEETEVLAGLLYFGEDKYRLKDVVMGEGTVSADIYDSDDSQVGSISLDSYPKGDKEMWAGTLTLNGGSYNAYVIQAARNVKAAEKAWKLSDYCEENPARCGTAMRAAGSIICDPEQEGETCRNRIRTFCEGSPEDRRCVALRMAYCKQNLDDADCRAEYMEKCKENLGEEICEKLGEVYNNALNKRPQLMNNAPGWVKTIRERIRTRSQCENAGGRCAEAQTAVDVGTCNEGETYNENLACPNGGWCCMPEEDSNGNGGNGNQTGNQTGNGNGD